MWIRMFQHMYTSKHTLTVYKYQIYKDKITIKDPFYTKKRISLPHILHLWWKLCGIYRQLKKCTHQTNAITYWYRMYVFPVQSQLLSFYDKFKSYGLHHDLVKRYGIYLSHMFMDMFRWRNHNHVIFSFMIITEFIILQ